MDVLHEKCAGIDISKRDAKVCVRLPGRRAGQYPSVVTRWGSTTNDVLALREHLLREQVTLERASEIQRVEKLLEDTGVKLSSVATDLTGVSSRAMLQALIEGERDPVVLANLAVLGLRAKILAVDYLPPFPPGR